MYEQELERNCLERHCLVLFSPLLICFITIINARVIFSRKRKLTFV